jgi:Ni/Co efflux regulator RcnB
MKKSLALLAAIALALPGMAQAQDRSAPRNQPQQEQSNNHGRQVSQTAHQFRQGQRFDRSKASNYRRLSYGQHSRLSRPPAGQVWVRSGSDALLVRLSDNRVQRVVASLF